MISIRPPILFRRLSATSSPSAGTLAPSEFLRRQRIKIGGHLIQGGPQLPRDEVVAVGSLHGGKLPPNRMINSDALPARSHVVLAAPPVGGPRRAAADWAPACAATARRQGCAPLRDPSRRVLVDESACASAAS